jgi:cation:H+ antiporter
VTSSTFVLGLFPLVASTILVQRRQVGLVTVLTAAGLALTIGFVGDGWLGRWEGAALVAAWAAFTFVVVKGLPGKAVDEPPAPASTQARAGRHRRTRTRLRRLWGDGSRSRTRAPRRAGGCPGVLARVLRGLDRNVLARARRRHHRATSWRAGYRSGDALGSSLVDATLSIGIGPLLFPAEVTPRLAVGASIYTLAAVAVVGALLGLRRRHDRRSALALLALYGFSYFVLLEIV